MKLLLLLIAFLCPIFHSFSQVIWTENFSAGSAARGTSAVGYPSNSGGIWSQTSNVLGAGEGISANQWYVSGEECGNAAGVCGSVCSNGDASLHVSAIGGLCGTPDCGAAYDETSTDNRTDKRIESPNISTIGYGGLTLSFNYIAAQADDGVSVVYSCDGGASWLSLAPLPATLCCDCNDAFLCASFGLCCGGLAACNGLGQGNWTNHNYVLPACTENISNLKIGFHWVNDGNGIGTDPSIAIDDITISSSIPLAVDLIEFTGKQQDAHVELNWSTASETDNAYFIIEKRTASGKFEEIGQVQGAGTSTETLHYHFIERKTQPGDNYYRLIMVDFNHVKTYSELIYVPFIEQFNVLSVYPNPNNGHFVAHIQSETQAIARFHLLDISGKAIEIGSRDTKQGVNTIELNLEGIEPGNYILEVEIMGRRKHKNIVIN